jgi:GntR family transcriptional regulator
MVEENEDSAKRPRYLQVRDQLTDMIASRKWAPGEALPSEAEIAQTFGVAQGTARSAIAMLASENVLVRRHGAGTFVYEHTAEEEQRRFFCLYDDRQERIGVDGQPGHGGPGRPVSADASRTERRELQLTRGSRVWRISRVRLRKGAPFILERISLPEDRFPGLADRARLPGALYELFQSAYNVLVVQVEERLSATLADAAAARALGVAEGAPLLRIERVALALGGKPVEWRVSLCHLHGARYITRLK